jgi:hypothetical protein
MKEPLASVPVLLIALVALTRSGSAQGSPQDSLALQYAATVVCGKPDHPSVAPGLYFTAINIHNPTPDTARFRAKIASTLPEMRPGRVSPFFSLALEPDQALEIDCRDLQRRARIDTFLKGFAVIESNVGLDVVAVYTAAGPTGQIETMHMERVPPRRDRAGCPDLVVDGISRPNWDGTNQRSVITATIRNAGTADAPPSLARLEDPSTLLPGGVPQNAIASTPALAPGQSASVTFYLPYWVYNPDATLTVTADYKNQVRECRETNNRAVFDDIG